MHYKSFEWIFSSFSFLFKLSSNLPLTRHCIMPTLQSLKSGSNDENSEFLKIKIEYCYNDQNLANLNGITNWGQSKLPKLIELQEMGLARSKNIFKMVRQILYKAVHQKSCTVIDLKGSRPPALGWFGQQDRGLPGPQLFHCAWS